MLREIGRFCNQLVAQELRNLQVQSPAKNYPSLFAGEPPWLNHMYVHIYIYYYLKQTEYYIYILMYNRLHNIYI